MRTSRYGHGSGGGDYVRLASMVFMSAVIGMMMYHARQAKNWTWLTGDDSISVEEAQQMAAGEKSPAETPAEQPLVAATGPTDLDDEEREAALEEFQAAADGSLEIHSEEMPLYARMLRWIQSQPLERLKQRAEPSKRFNSYIQEADVERGTLVKLQLNVARAIKLEDTQEIAGFKELYELWGWTEASQGWLFTVITPELPPNFPVADRIEEKVTVYAYYFKVQGYHATGAGPRDPAQKAPLFIGRIDWTPPPPLPKNEAAPWVFDWWVVAVFFVITFALIRYWLKAQAAKPAIFERRSVGDPVATWLAPAETVIPTVVDEPSPYEGSDPRAPETKRHSDPNESSP